METSHGVIATPVFMPVGTQGTVKGLTPKEVGQSGAQCVLGNTYHLWLRPGPEVIAAAGGLHQFIGWPASILTDSGGFQVLSLSHLGCIDEDGATFRSHLNETVRKLTPELAMEVQAALASDIAMVLDVCPPHPCDLRDLREATERTTRWAERSIAAHHIPWQAVFGIVQGGVDVDLRRSSAREIAAMGFDGYGLGGFRVGEERGTMWPALDAALAELPPDRPRYLMGVGEPDDLLDAIAHGVDMFDCVLPTRLGRNGTVMTDNGRVDLRRSSLEGSSAVLDSTCDCAACTHFSVGYIHHLVRSGEELGLRLASLHNVRYLIRLVEGARSAIVDGDFDAYRARRLRHWRRADRAVGSENRARWLQAKAREER